MAAPAPLSCPRGAPARGHPKPPCPHPAGCRQRSIAPTAASGAPCIVFQCRHPSARWGRYFGVSAASSMVWRESGLQNLVLEEMSSPSSASPHLWDFLALSLDLAAHTVYQSWVGWGFEQAGPVKVSLPWQWGWTWIFAIPSSPFHDSLQSSCLSRGSSPACSGAAQALGAWADLLGFASGKHQGPSQGGETTLPQCLEPALSTHPPPHPQLSWGHQATLPSAIPKGPSLGHLTSDVSTKTKLLFRDPGLNLPTDPVCTREAKSSPLGGMWVFAREPEGFFCTKPVQSRGSSVNKSGAHRGGNHI